MGKVSKIIYRYLIITLAAALMASSTYILVIPNDFAPSGISGICVMVQYLFKFSIGYLNVIINLPLCIIAFIMGYRRFAVRSYYFCLVYSGLYVLIQNINPTFLQYDANGQDTMLPVLIAGIISGLVTVMCYESLGSQCGTDIISKILSEKKPEFNFFFASFIINSVVALASLFVYAFDENLVFNASNLNNYKPVALCVLYCLSDSLLADVIWKNGKEASEFIVITSSPDQIIEQIMKITHHTGTILDGQGVYSGDDKTVLIFVVNKFQVPQIKRLLKRYPDTFSYIATVNETVGYFDSRRVKGAEKKIEKMSKEKY